MAETEQKKQPAAGGGRGRRYYHFNRNHESKTSYKSKVAGLEDDVFDVGATSNPAKFSKSIKSIENYIQKTYKSAEDVVKAIQKLRRPTLNYLAQPKKSEHVDASGASDDDAYEMAQFTW